MTAATLPGPAPDRRDILDFPVDQVVAAGRLVLAPAGLLALWLDPDQPAKYAETTYVVLIAYLLFALGLALAALRPPFAPGVRAAVHVIDIVALSLVMQFTEGPTSPYFVVFSFALLSATLYWGAHGAFTTAAALVLLFLVIASVQSTVFAAPVSVDFIIIRAAFLVVAAAMLAYVAAYRDRVRAQLSVLAGEASAADERARLARDLHDGTLQVLTASALRLKQAADAAPEAQRGQIENIRQLLAEQQRRLRRFVTEALQRHSTEPSRVPFLLASELAHVLSEVERTWGCATSLQVQPSGTAVDASVGQQLKPIVAEAAANAVRHGQAKRLDVAVTRTPAGLSLRIANDGLPFAAAAKRASNGHAAPSAPASISHRVAALGGSLSVSSGEGGVALLIELPP